VTGNELIAIVIVAVAVSWLVSLAWHPYGPCPRPTCNRGHGSGSTETRWNKCRKCGGRGEVVRRGARPVRKAIGRPL
jgi:hypothetical protein